MELGETERARLRERHDELLGKIELDHAVEAAVELSAWKAELAGLKARLDADRLVRAGWKNDAGVWVTNCMICGKVSTQRNCCDDIPF